MAETTLVPVPSEIADDERLGRQEWSNSTARKVRGRQLRGESPRVPANKFMPPNDSSELSVDRMDHAELDELAKLAEKNTARKDPSLKGWYTLSAADVIGAKCAVQSSPLSGNPYHADILIPVKLDQDDRRDALIEFALDLACLADFEPWDSVQDEATQDRPEQS